MTLWPNGDIEAHEDVELWSGVRLKIPRGRTSFDDFRYVDTGDHLVEMCEAAWATHSNRDSPMNFRLVGPPGVGKNALVYRLAQKRNQELFEILGHEEFTAEDLLVSPTLVDGKKVQYIASPLVAAMVTGGICFIDEIAKMRPRSLAPLSSLLDTPRSVYSALLGRRIQAHPDFRFCAAYNPTDADAFALAPWLLDRTLPEIQISLPSSNVLSEIVLHQNREWKDWEEAVAERAQADGIVLDPRKMLHVVAYTDRLDILMKEADEAWGDPLDIAYRHVLGRIAGFGESDED